MIDAIERVDLEVAEAIKAELNRQKSKIELIASENFVSEAVLQAAGTILTNKYAEGYPGKRYYGGCEHVDVIESLAIERAKRLFHAEHANVQPHSGSQANMAVYFSHLQPGDTVLGMSLSHGGHLTHGHPINISGKYYNFIAYGVDKETERIDYDEVLRLAEEYKPKLILAGASAYPRVIDFIKFREIADRVGARLMVDMAHIAGLVATDLHPTPIPYAEYVTTTTHKTLRGPRSGLILCKNEYAKDIDRAVFPGIQGGPLMHIIAAKAVALREAMSEEFKSYQQNIVKNSKALAKGLLDRGFRLVSGGTDNHLILVDLTNKGITGKEAEEVLDNIGITVNKNTIPFDTRSPFVTSGIRIGTPAVTTRGFGEAEMTEIADIMRMVLSEIENEDVKKKASERVDSLCQRFPIY